MEKLTYSEKLKDPRWQKKRLEIMGRDNFTCQLCGDIETTLNIHHKKYTTDKIWDELNENLITICKHCHYIIHNLDSVFLTHDHYFIDGAKIYKNIDYEIDDTKVYFCCLSEQNSLNVFLLIDNQEELSINLKIPFICNHSFDTLIKSINNSIKHMI